MFKKTEEKYLLNLHPNPEFTMSKKRVEHSDTYKAEARAKINWWQPCHLREFLILWPSSCLIKSTKSFYTISRCYWLQYAYVNSSARPYNCTSFWFLVLIGYCWQAFDKLSSKYLVVYIKWFVFNDLDGWGSITLWKARLISSVWWRMPVFLSKLSWAFYYLLLCCVGSLFFV